MNRTRNVLVTAAAFTLLVAAGLVGTSAAQQTPPATAATIGQPAPDFTLNDQDGHAVSLRSFRGKVVVLEWQNPGCPFVQRAYSKNEMKSEAARHPAAQVAWLAIDSTRDGTPQISRDFRAAQHLAYPILQDRDSRVARLYAARTTPHMFVIDRAGLLRYMGAIDDDPRGQQTHPRNYVGEAVDALLAGHAPPVASTEPYGCGVHY